MSTTRFASKRGRFNSYNILLIIILLIIGTMMALTLSYEIAMLTIFPLLFMVLFINTTYEITPTEIIRYSNKMAGLRIFIPDIKKIEQLPKGLKVWYSQKDFVWIKVKEEEKFVTTLTLINPAILISRP